jgi:hypothetical protein
VWIEPVIAQEMMTLRAGTVFSSFGSAQPMPGEGIDQGERSDAFMVEWLGEFVEVRCALLVEGRNAFL